MTTQEQTQMYIANCKCCTLANILRDCKRCKFNVGLLHKTSPSSMFDSMKQDLIIINEIIDELIEEAK